MSSSLDLPAQADLKSLRFRKEREADWTELERIVNAFERRGVAGLSNEDMLAAPVLYRATLSALSVARSTTLDKAVVDYLETLCARAYFFIYGSRATVWEKLASFLRVDWHSSVKSLWRETTVSGLLFCVGVIIAFALFRQSPEWYFAFVPGELASGRDPSASVESLRDTLYGSHSVDDDGLSIFATFLFTHNAGVALLMFALGFAFGVPTSLLLISNGAMMGMFIALFASNGLGMEVGGWLSIHGVTEIFAIILAGAAGLNLGRAMAFPAGQSRLDALAAAGLVSGSVMAGVVVMLFVAGILEGFGRQLINDDLSRYTIGITSGIIWLLYFYAPRGRKADTTMKGTPKPVEAYGSLQSASKMQRAFVTPEGVDLRLELGDGSQRASAFAIDLSVMITVLVGFTLLLGAAGLGSSSIGGVQWVVIIWLLGAFFLRNFYFAAFELSAKAATPGKRMLGLRVAARNGGRLSAQAVLVRNALRELEFFIPLSVIGTRVDGGGGEGWMYLLALVWVAIFALFPLFNKDRLRPGDLVAGTWVVRVPKQTLLRDVVEESSSDNTTGFVFTQEQIAAYGVKELQVLEQVLRVRDDETMSNVAQRISSKIGLPHRWDQDHYAFLSAYYAALRRHLENNLLMGKRRADKYDV